MASTSRSVAVTTSTGTGRQANETADIALPQISTGRSAAVIGVLTEAVTIAQFTDGGSTSGTYQMAGSIPAGAVALLSKVGPITGFAGDTTAVLIIGDGSDTDRYNTSTVNVFTTQAVGVDAGIRSGLALHTATVRPTLTVTTGSDFTLAVTNAGGALTVQIFYIEPLL